MSGALKEDVVVDVTMAIGMLMWDEDARGVKHTPRHYACAALDIAHVAEMQAVVDAADGYLLNKNGIVPLADALAALKAKVESL